MIGVLFLMFCGFNHLALHVSVMFVMSMLLFVDVALLSLGRTEGYNSFACDAIAAIIAVTK